jgi:hypothetical protein
MKRNSSSWMAMIDDYLLLSQQQKGVVVRIDEMDGVS